MYQPFLKPNVLQEGQNLSFANTWFKVWVITKMIILGQLWSKHVSLNYLTWLELGVKQLKRWYILAVTGNFKCCCFMSLSLNFRKSVILTGLNNEYLKVPLSLLHKKFHWNNRWIFQVNLTWLNKMLDFP